MKDRNILGLIVLSFLHLGIYTIQAQETKIVARALTSAEISAWELDSSIQKSPGIMTIGVGDAIYLEVVADKEQTVSDLSWELVSKPRDSIVGLMASPLPDEMESYSPGDKILNQVVGRKLLVPDYEGIYEIKAMLTVGGEAVEVSANVTASYYVGVGIIENQNPSYPQCALCHVERAESWLGTAHAGTFERGIDGISSDHFSSHCTSCHVTGFNESETAVNGGFDDIALEAGWTFLEHAQAGEWDAMPMALKQMSNVQCEACHGPGNLHHGDVNTISVSMSSGDCGQCHDAEPYHVINKEWNMSRHAISTRRPTGEGRGSCVRCHSGIGFVDVVKGKEEVRLDYEAITCSVCHDPHDATNAHQLRKIDGVTLENGVVVTEGGTGKLCMNCHTSRQDADDYATAYHSHYGPHHGPQTDMLVGTNAIEYGRDIQISTHLYALEDACASCHMQETQRTDAHRGMVGGHTFMPAWDSDTLDDESDDVVLTGICVECHGPMNSFDIKRLDYNNDGKLEGVMTEIGQLLHQLALRLPPVGEAEVSVSEEYTPAQLKAAFNYLFVEEDGSHGIHNTGYAVGILKASLADLDGYWNTVLSGDNNPNGSPWYLSNWFGYYYTYPDSPKWVYHSTMGYVYVSEDSNAQNVNIYSPDFGWVYTSPTAFPDIYVYDRGWFFMMTDAQEQRWLYEYSTGEWINTNLQ